MVYEYFSIEIDIQKLVIDLIGRVCDLFVLFSKKIVDLSQIIMYF